MRYLWLLLLCGCFPMVETVYKPVAVVFVPDSLMGNAYGRTTCDKVNNEALVMVRSSLLNNTNMAERVISHEMVHAKQADEHPKGCVGMAKDYATNDKYRFEIEAEAYCTILAAYKLWANYEGTEQHLWVLFGERAFDRETSRKKFRSICDQMEVENEARLASR